MGRRSPRARGSAEAINLDTYNALTDSNLLDLRDNRAGPGLQRPEAIINPRFRSFGSPLVVRFSGH